MSINPCGTDITTAGPFPQTLFMGLSIKSFNLNLGWGGEPSSCSVKLVYDPSHHWSHGSFQGFNSNIDSKLSTSTKDRSSSAFDPQQLEGSTVTPDENLTLHTAPAKRLQDSQSTRNALQSTYGDVKRNDTGKKIWQVNSDTPFDWVGPDPGFLADDLGILRNIDKNSRNLDVMGSMVHFRYDDVIFNGIVKGWNYNNGLVDVQIDSPTNLLKGTKIILKDYTGTISSTINGASFGDGGAVAVPFDDSTIDAGFNATIFNGNIPNLINIFGYKGFQNVGYSEQRGVSLGLAYDAINELLCAGSPVKNKWNPYGCIIGKAVRDRNNAAYLDHSTTLGTTFGEYEANRWNIFNTRSATDSINRPHIKLDLSSVPRPPNAVYINEVSISLLDFIDKCCEPLGFDYWVELQDKNPGSYDAVLKVHTVSRRFQPPVNIIKNLVQTFDESDFVTDYKFGQEFQDSKTRSVVMGGKQQRLFQVGTNNLARYRNRRVYEPALDQHATYNLNNNFNYYREPSTSKPRNLTGGQPYYNKDGAVVAQPLPNDFATIDTHPQNQMSIVRGSYHAPQQPQGTTGAGGRSSSFTPSNYSLAENDFIKPYMGKDIYGNNRTTYFMQGANGPYLGEMFVQIPTYDLAQYFPAGDAPNVAGNVNVSETEIRAAMGGFESWKNYIFEMPVLGKTIGMSQYIFIYLRNKFGSTFATSLFLNTANMFSGDKGKLTTLPAPRGGGKVSLETYLPYTEAINPILSSLHSFFEQLGRDHYGKTYLVRLPNVTSYVDAENIRRYNYEICDKAWEESLNFIDDTIQIGSNLANQMANEDGTFGPILGFNNTAEYDSFFNEASTSNAFFNASAIHNRMIASTAQKNPQNWYWPLIHDIPRQDIFYSPFKAQLSPEDHAQSQSYYDGALPVVNPQFPSANSVHGFSVPQGYRWKMYCKASVLNVYPGAVANGNLTSYFGNPHCVLSAPSNVFAVSPNSLAKTMMEEMLVHTRGAMSSASPQLRRIRFGYLLAWARSEKGLSVSSTDLSNEVGQRQNLPIGLKAAHPLFAAVPLKSNVSCYGPWTSHPGLGHTNDSTLFTDPNPISQINNLVGEVNFSSEPDAQPWNYGGMKNLDDAILTRIKDSNYYQQVLEAGYVTAAGVLFRNTNLGERLVNNGPLVNSLSVQIGDDGFTATCNMRTYNRKLGFFNKQDADLIQERGRNAIIARQKTAYELRESLLGSNKLGGVGGGGNSGGGSGGNSGSSSNGVNSANSLLVGGAAPYLHGTSSLGPGGLYDTVGFDPIWPYRPGAPAGQGVSPMQFPMQKAQTMLFDEQNIGNIMTQDFAKKSIMSLDGIFSPISFYPTPYGGTFPMTFYHRSKCPYCNGGGSYTYQEFRPPSNGGGSVSASQNARSSRTKPCFFCKPDATADAEKGVNNRASPSLVSPPVLLVNAADNDGVNEGQVLGAGNQINKFTLNPIVMTNGEFSLEDAKGEGDTCGHSIDVVGFGEDPPTQGSSLRATSSNFISYNYDDQGAQVNQRFFGLRGPVMVHGWGYDKEGYPVPNASGELKTLEDGTRVSITQSYDSDGRLTNPYKLNRFFKGWAQNPGSWPVGPVDLRWDNDAGVWTVGSNFKNVWVTIEIDLKDGQPTRGTVYKDAAEALPEGLRRLVYVKDSSGGYAAPRGADIYCSYDADSGYYVPLYNQALMASGIIQSDSSAKIYQSYKSNYDEDNPTSYVATISNPLNLNATAGNVGLFTYVNGKWVLTNVK